jgi:hypothetical protein
MFSAPQLTALASFANGVNAVARRERYHFDKLGGRPSCILLYQMLLAAGCDDTRDEVLLGLVEYMTRQGWSAARARTRAARRRRGEDA